MVTFDFDRLKELSRIISDVKVSDPVIKEYTFVVVYANIFNEDGSNMTSIKKAIGEDPEEAKDDVLHMIAPLAAIGYRIKSIELVDCIQISDMEEQQDHFRLSEVINTRLYKITRASKVEESSIWYSDTETGEINDASELIPDWGK